MKGIPGNFDKLVDSYISDNEVTQIDEVAPLLALAGRAGAGLGSGLAKLTGRAGSTATRAGKPVTSGVAKATPKPGKAQNALLDVLSTLGAASSTPGNDRIDTHSTDPAEEPDQEELDQEEDPAATNQEIKKLGKDGVDAGINQQVATAPKVKKIPMNIQKQIVDGALNSTLGAGVNPSILKRQVRKAIQQVK